jgi:hypothetical protein
MGGRFQTFDMNRAAANVLGVFPLTGGAAGRISKAKSAILCQGGQITSGWPALQLKGP